MVRVKKGVSPQKAPPQAKKNIPTAFREQIWLRTMGKVFEGKCPIQWCQNVINVYDFQAGHNIPESKGGKTTPDNLVPICSRCNLSMGNKYTIDEWNKLSANVSSVEVMNASPFVPVVSPKKKWWCCFAF
jgi:hypothetical protein